jgi:arylsulfatase A-like enzyme
MGRKILFVTTDQQRYDTVGCNGGTVGRTPVIDRLAAEGIRYERAVPQSVVCMPSRATMLTGQHPATHGVWMNGVALPVDAPSVAAELHRAGYRTALVGKPHFEPFLDPFARFVENRLAREGVATIETRWADGTFGPHRGFDHLEFATHSPAGPLHYGQWLMQNHPEAMVGFYRVLDGALEVNAEGGGHTGAPQVHDNPVPRDQYHTDWVADRTIAWLDGLAADDDWFCWMSFPDPHHPWDPPASELGRVLAAIEARGWGDDVDIVFTTDHGELQGDFGLLFKGPYHVDGLMRLPLVWRPARAAAVAPAVVPEPVGLVDLAPTFCQIAGLTAPEWMEGQALPTMAGAGSHERVLTEWDSELHGVSISLRSITRDGWVATACLPSTEHDGTEGELYSLVDDPLQRTNRWHDPAVRALRDDLLADLRASLPPPRRPRLPVEAPV